MKCINMKIGGFIIFLANFITISSSCSQQDITPSQMTIVKGEDIFKSKFNKDCPQLLEIVKIVNKKYNLTEYGINCKTLPSETTSKERPLQNICFVVRDLLNVICDKNLNMTTESLKQDNTDICPFIFSHLNQFGIKFQHNELIELIGNNSCKIVCYDINKPQPQCIVLSLYNNYLKRTIQSINQKHLVQSQTENSQNKLAEIKTTIKKTEKPVVSTKIEQQQENNEVTKIKTEATLNKFSEAAVTPSKAMKVENKTVKTEAITLTPKKEQTSESEMKALGNENLLPESIDEQLNNEEDLDQMDISSDVAPIRNIPKMESIEDKNFISSSKIYSDNGFFQAEDSHFFFYFIMVSSVIVLGYLAFHNKNKILAYALEGTSSRRRGRRPNSARYKKLETNLEEVISSSSTNVAASSVVY